MSATSKRRLLAACVLILLVAIPFLPAASLSDSAPVRVASTVSRAAAPPAPNSSKRSCCADREATAKEHVRVASYYSVKGGLQAILTLNNKGPHPMEARLTLFSLAGARREVASISVAASSYRVVDLSQHAAAGTPFEEGSLQVAYHGMDLEMGGQVKLIDARRSLSFDEQLVEMGTKFTSSRLEGVWWLPSAQSQMRLILSNTTDSPVLVTADAGEAPKPGKAGEFTLGPHETRLIDVRLDKAAYRGSTLPDVGGVTVRHSGAPGAVVAHAMIQEPSTGYSAVVEFTDPASAKSAKLHGGGLRLGTVGGEELKPVIAARNVGSAPAVLSGRIPYTADDGAGVVPLPDLSLAPGETKLFDTSSLQLGGSNPTSAGLEFEHTGEPGMVVVSAVSVSDSRNHSFRVPLIDPVGFRSSSGGYPWYITGTSSTVVHIKNVTDQPQSYRAYLYHEGGVYMPPLQTVGPGQTTSLDIRAWRDNQVPDANGEKLSPGATRGHIQWSATGGGRQVMIGRAEQADEVKGVSSTYACMSCCGNSFYSAYVSPETIDLFAEEDAIRIVPMQQDTSCYGLIYPPFQAGPASWTSANTNICEVLGLVTGVAPGSTVINANWVADMWSLAGHNECQYNPVSVAANTLCNVLTSAIFFRKATYWTDVEATFAPNLGRYTTSLNLGSSSRASHACNGDEFAFIVEFDLPEHHHALRPPPFTFVRPAPDNQYTVRGWEIYDVTQTSAKMSVSVKRNGEGTNNGIQIVILGVYQSGAEYQGRATVRLVCPNP